MTDSILIISGLTPACEELSLMGGDSKTNSVKIDELEKNIKDAGPGLQRIVNTIREATISSGLKEVTVSLSITGSGKIGLLGTGAEFSSTSTLTLKFDV